MPSGWSELDLILPYLTSADKIIAQGDVHQQFGLLRHADVADFEIGAAVALTRVTLRDAKTGIKGRYEPGM